MAPKNCQLTIVNYQLTIQKLRDRDIPKTVWFVIPPEAVIQKETFYALEKLLVWRLYPVLKKVPAE